MTKETKYLPQDLFEEDYTRDDLLAGYIPESWMKIEDAQVTVWQKALEQQIAERQENQTEEEKSKRTRLIQHHLDEYFLPPSFDNGPYAITKHLSLSEILSKIIDLDKETATLPEKDERITFTSGILEKSQAILSWLKDKIINSLPEGSKFTDKQITDMFNNIKQEQMDTLIKQIIDSGLLIQALTHREKWEKVIAESNNN